MGFLNGRVTFTRYRVGGDSPLPFSDELLEIVSKQAIGKGGLAAADGISVGWSGGDHVLDVSFDLGKNVVNDALHLAMRTDTDKVPGTLLKAYTQIELAAISANNPSGRPTKAQRQEAKEAALARAEADAADGRFRRMSHFPVLWDGQQGILYAGTASSTARERLVSLFRETFDRTLEPISAGTLAGSESEADGLGAATLSLFGGEQSELAAVAWSENAPNVMDQLGNEFLVWLWHTIQNVSDTIPLSDNSDVAVMMAKTLTLDCPLGETGRDSLTDDSPTRLPEAFRALQSGKLPRKAGLIVVRHGAQYELTLQAESMAVSGASFPKPEEQGLSAEDVKSARVDSLRHLAETIDLLYDAYLRRRNGSSWSKEVSRIKKWLSAA
ncbi:hypothetical protein [Aquisphaera insulae]|uniref:hypothetical protein n=1 Tax=Aquisphaera insulae TaxID=2712864 RepID=UPI0013EB3755|nr:hypothetical protein [Aquisphaera insulae]